MIVPARDAGRTIGEQLEALSKQTYTCGWELIVVDNGSRDGTPDVVRGYRDLFDCLELITADEHVGPAYARNEGVKRSRGELLAFCDADDIVDNEWLEKLVAAAVRHDAVGGRLELREVNDPVVASWTPLEDGLIVTHDFLPFASSSNLAVWRDVFVAVGGFRSYMRTGEDAALSWDIQLAGHDLGYARDAVVHSRRRASLMSLGRQFHAYGVGRALRYREYRASGAKRRSFAGTLRAWLALIFRLPGAVWSRERRGRWAQRFAMELGHLRGAVRYGVWFHG